MITIERLIEIVREARPLFDASEFTVDQKGGYANIVTSADLAVQAYLQMMLEDELPGSGFICEESDVYDPAHEYVWIIDPIDGTANYARGIEQCAICVGLRDSAGMLMSCVYLPRTEEMFYAVRGEGAYRNGERICVSTRPFADTVMATALPVYHKEMTPVCSRIISDVFMRCNDIRRFGAAAPELCYLAMGRIDTYFEWLLSPWDYAAASLIITEAGGVIANLAGDEIDLLRPGGVLAANNRDNLEELQTIVKSHLTENRE